MFTMDNLISAFTAAWQRSFDYTGRSTAATTGGTPWRT
jgi:hypothetical protein